MDEPASVNVRVPERVAEATGNDLLRLLANERCRLLLAVLDEHESPLGERALARLVAAAETGVTPDAVDETNLEAVAVALHHSCLPALVSAGLLERTGTEVRTIGPVPRWVERTYGYRLEGFVGSAAAVDRALDLLADPRRRVVFALLKANGEVPVDELAEELNELESSDSDVIDGMAEIRTELHHVHLPKLIDTGVVERSGDGHWVRYVGHPLFDEWWFSSSPVAKGGGGERTMRMVMCRLCGMFVPAAQNGDGWAPTRDVCPDCGGTTFEDHRTGRTIDTE